MAKGLAREEEGQPGAARQGELPAGSAFSSASFRNVTLAGNPVDEQGVGRSIKTENKHMRCDVL